MLSIKRHLECIISCLAFSHVSHYLLSRIILMVGFITLYTPWWWGSLPFTHLDGGIHYPLHTLMVVFITLFSPWWWGSLPFTHLDGGVHYPLHILMVGFITRYTPWWWGSLSSTHLDGEVHNTLHTSMAGFIYFSQLHGEVHQLSDNSTFAIYITSKSHCKNWDCFLPESRDLFIRKVD